MIEQSITIKDLPMSPSANKLFATSWKTKRRFKSRDYVIYERMLTHWCKLNASRLADAREFTSKLDPGEAFRVDCTFYFSRSQVLTKKNTIKKRDTSNYLKATHDGLSKILDVDDCLFIDGSFETKILNSDHPGFCDVTISIIQIEGL